MTKFGFEIQTSNNGMIDIPLLEGNVLFVLGANGVGKSSLMQNLFNQNTNNTKRIVAHRQTWFNNNSMNMTASQKKDTEQNMINYDKQVYSRWKDDYSQARSNMTIFDLINSENVRARKIAGALDAGEVQNAKNLSLKKAPLQAINELLEISNIPIIITLGKDEQLFASKNGSELYSIAELSDGERNALLICSDVLTTEQNNLIILDEPERHLHRSIISPLLSSLFQKRKDCVFVISTHDIFLPINHSESSALLLRSCQWNGKNIKDWDADLINEADKIPNSLKHEILGAKRNILFVEGENESLDRQIYQLIFPNVTVISQGSCTQVEKSVEGIRRTEKLHWINAYGLIDADDRTKEQIKTLFDKGIVALECYSVESLYYNLKVVGKIAKRYSEVTGFCKKELYNKATSEISKNIQQHKERLCSRLCEKQVRNKIMTALPKHKDFGKRDEFKYKLNLKDIIEKEESLFDKLIADNDLDGLIRRYPVRETQVLTMIAKGLGLTRKEYECSVRKLIIDDENERQYFKTMLNKLTSIIDR
jgi:ABC-type cobalamin/Fe3+-siderophores transport system ATPase subunit